VTHRPAPAPAVRIGTRGSALALAQTRIVADALAAATGLPVELVPIVTAGDRSAAPVAQLGVGVFVSALREALAAKEIDVAVHSYKDLPTAPSDGLCVAAVPERADPRDALVARDRLRLAELPAGARVGTAAPRRVAQLRALRPGLELVPVRGNVDTRLSRVAGGELDAVVVARAGLDRLGRGGEITDILDPAVLLPAPAQGALAVECRAADGYLVELLGRLDHPPTRAAVSAERALMSTLEAGCTAPVAGLAALTGGGAGAGELRLHGAVISPDGRRILRLTRTGTSAGAVELGHRLAGELLDAGARSLLAGSRPTQEAQLEHDSHDPYA
jgi:hydroxymethylbilane synthase